VPKPVIPQSPEELEEILHDPEQVKAIFGDPQASKEFLTAYSRNVINKDNEFAAQLREQVQLGMAEFLKASGVQNGPPVDISDTGSPTLAGREVVGLGPAGLMARKQSFYNKASYGAKLDGKFATVGDFMRAVAQEGAGRQFRDGAKLDASLSQLKEIQNSFGTDVPSDGGFLLP